MNFFPTASAPKISVNHSNGSLFVSAFSVRGTEVKLVVITTNIELAKAAALKMGYLNPTVTGEATTVDSLNFFTQKGYRISEAGQRVYA